MSADVCGARHTKYQPSDAEWQCPTCGAGAEFVIDESENGSGFLCGQLHEEDELRCYYCEYASTGETFAAKLQKAANMVPCSCCKGTGLVKGPA